MTERMWAMAVVEFSSFRLTEYPDARIFEREVGSWLTLREAENAYFLGDLPQRIRDQLAGVTPRPRLLALKDGAALVAAGMLYPHGRLVSTWATPEMMRVMVDGLAKGGCQISGTFGPAYVAWQLAKMWTERMGGRWELDRDERVYQLSRVGYRPSATGRLSVATEADGDLVGRWLAGFQREAAYEAGSPLADIQKMLIKEGRLFLWRDPEAVAMAAWVAPTPHGGCINFVYVPPEARGKGHGKSVVAALANHVMSQGVRYCFIFTDTQHQGNNQLYQSVGARTVAEILQCRIIAPEVKPAAVRGGLNITNMQAQYLHRGVLS